MKALRNRTIYCVIQFISFLFDYILSTFFFFFFFFYPRFGSLGIWSSLKPEAILAATMNFFA